VLPDGKPPGKTLLATDSAIRVMYGSASAGEFMVLASADATSAPAAAGPVEIPLSGWFEYIADMKAPSTKWVESFD
jgi:hypothetical protein